MKLLNQSLKWLMLPLLLIITLWAFIFYFVINNEIKGSVDEGLDNYKRQVISKLLVDSTVINTSNLDKGVYYFRPISVIKAHRYKDRYIDTLIYMQDADDPIPELEPVRMLSTAIEHNNEYYELNIIQPMVEQDDLIKQLSWNILALFITLLLIVLICNNLILHRLWNPFYTILEYIKTYRLGSSKDKLPDNIKTNTKEFYDLQVALNALLKDNTETFEQQKIFIGNASHELQTPLAITRNKLELLIEDGDLNNNQAQTISEITMIIERIIKMNKSLLLLSKIDNRQYIDNQDISINSVVKRSINELMDIMDFKSITLTYKENNDINVLMDPSLADVIVANLIKNSIFHNNSGGSINIHISGNRLSVCNTGDKTPLDGSKVFDRFYKNDNHNKGSGLGLSIVKSICNLYKFSIEYKSNLDMHCFKITFHNNL